ncbi:MAG: xanthine dehydrogenase family protein molybdopterin-binding subunit [Anaerolineae bacterium]|nr:xanthine dehydrogenase family protein molybdopterin-binding subunit [Anaerolineae bacterium]
MSKRYINQSLPRIDAEAKVTGAAKYPGDFIFDNQLYMKVKFAEVPHAVIEAIDLRDANQVSGVLMILTAKDVPVNEYGLQVKDQPVLCGPGSDIPGADHVRFVGDQVACVIAETLEGAEEAVEKIQISYKHLPVVVNPEEAMSDNCIRLHENVKNNIAWYDRVRKGNPEEGFSRCDVIIENDYITPVQEHAYLQPEAGCSYLDDDGRIVVIIGGQWAHDDQHQIAHSLGLPLEKIRVIYPAIGGAFGGREDMSLQIVLALAVYRLEEIGIVRPVKCVWSREESIMGHGKRHRYHIHSKWGATKEGKVIVSETRIIEDAGAYMYTSNKVMGNAILLCNGPYEIPNVAIDAYAVYTNNIPGAAFRGFGGPQAIFAGEMQMNKLAEALGMDPVEVRMRNILREGSLINVNTPIPEGVTMAETLLDCCVQAGWILENGKWRRPSLRNYQNKATHIQKGVGIAAGFKNIGFSYGYPEHCWATIELFGTTDIEKVVLRHAAAEVGQGAHTAILQMTAEALGVDINIIEYDYSDTLTSRSSGSVSASRMTFMAGNSVKEAAKIALHRWDNGERPVKVVHRYLAPQTTNLDPETGYSMPNFSYAYASECVELEVDTETGIIRLLKVIVSDDVGIAINPRQVRGQIEGAVVQAAGYTLLENFIQEDGHPKTYRFSTYLIPTVLDIPERVDNRILEFPDPRGPWGARGVGELPYLAFAPAVMDALHDATGIWFDEFPLTPERVLRGLGKL